MSDTRITFFTLERCYQALILVKPIVEDIVEKRKTLKELKAHQQVCQSNILKEKIKKLVYEIMYHLNELKEIGCYFQDFDSGLVYFPMEQGDDRGCYFWTLESQEVSVR